jgi:hypothetical protein
VLPTAFTCSTCSAEVFAGRFIEDGYQTVLVLDATPTTTAGGFLPVPSDAELAPRVFPVQSFPGHRLHVCSWVGELGS